jgi:hypothetical protein
VGFAPSGLNYLPQFYTGASSLSGAEPVAVTTGSDTSGIDAALAVGGQISGTVTDASTTSPVAGVEVILYDSNGDLVALAQTTSDGTYTITGLITGSYRVGFNPGGTYVPQFYNGKSSLAVADTVSVTAGATATGVDAALHRTPFRMAC